MRWYFNFLFCLVGFSTAWGQACCGVGSSRGPGASGAIGAQKFSVGTGLVLSQASKQFSGTRPYVGPFDESLRRLEYRLEVGYGITDRLSATVGSDFQWRSKRAVYPEPVGTQDWSNLGLGDGKAALSFALIPFSVLDPYELSVGLNIGIPWGSTNNSSDGVLLSRDLQSGSGHWSSGVSLSGLVSWPSLHFGISANLAGQMRYTGDVNGDTRDPGDEITAAASILVGPWGPVRLIAGGNFRYTGKDVRKVSGEDLVVDGTGGKWFYAIPGIELTTAQNVAILLDAEILVSSYVNGIQRVTNPVIRSWVNFYL